MSIKIESLAKPIYQAILPYTPCEQTHELTVQLLQSCSPTLLYLLRFLFETHIQLPPVKVMGFEIEGPGLILAAGMLKYLPDISDNKHAISAFEALKVIGYGAAEIGSVLAYPNPGNDGEKLHRYPKDQAAVNHYGLRFPDHAAPAFKAAASHQQRFPSIPVGINIACNPQSETLTAKKQDLDKLVVSFADYAQFFAYLAFNFSCPNVNGVSLEDVLELISHFSNQVESLGIKTPAAIKLSPDTNTRDLAMILDTVLEHPNIKGIIAFNTSRQHSYNFEGGVSGDPSYKINTHKLVELNKLLEAKNAKIDVIYSGGLRNARQMKFIKGLGNYVKAFQIFTALAYSPWVIADIKRELATTS
jgi:dihydroorotate dehydrogenase